MLGMASPTAYDLNFRLLGIPVRVHPLFWLIMVLLSGQDTDLRAILVFVGCAFVSILVHEFGHGLSSRHFGYRPTEIVLYGMGGYCLCDIERQTPVQRLVVLFSGPGAGFLLMFAMMILGGAVFGVTPADDLRLMGLVLGISSDVGMSRSFFNLPAVTRSVYVAMIEINLMWGVLNLLPIWPLDGGRITEVLLGMLRRRDASRVTHIVSLLTAGFLAVIFFRKEQIGLGIWFIYFGFINYQVLQALHQNTNYSSYEDDADWWKR